MNRFVRPFPEKENKEKRQGMCTQLNASYLQNRARHAVKLFRQRFLYEYFELLPGKTSDRRDKKKEIMKRKELWKTSN